MIPPGQVGEVRTELNTATMSGRIGKGVSVFTNAADSPNLQLVIKARVVGSAIMLPGYKGVLSNRVSETRSQPFLIRKEPGEVGDLDITGARASVDWIDVDVRHLTERWPAEKGLPSGRPGDWLMQVRLKPNAPIGRSMEEVRFKTGLKLEPEVVISIGADIHPPINLNAPQVSLVAGEERTILASLRKDLPPQPVTVTAPDGLSARTEPGAGRFFKLHLKWDGPVPGEPSELQLDVAGETQKVPVVVAAAN